MWSGRREPTVARIVADDDRCEQRVPMRVSASRTRLLGLCLRIRVRHCEAVIGAWRRRVLHKTDSKLAVG